MDIDNTHDEMDDNDEFDEFLFESIRRYNTLQIFYLENEPSQLLQMDFNSLCVGSKRTKGENSELLRLRLPPKLTLPPEAEGRCKSNDFNVLSGLYTESTVYKIDKLPKVEQIIASEFGVTGLKIYTLSQSSLGTKNQGIKLDVTDWTNSDFLVTKDTNTVICSKCSCEPLIQVDVEAGKKIKEIRHPFQSSLEETKSDSCTENNIKVQSFDTGLITVLNCQTGDMVIHDLRTDGNFTTFPSVKKECSEIWTLSSCDSQENLNYFGILSNKKSFYIYDKRSNTVVIENQGTDSSNGSSCNLKLKFSKSGDKFSISGIGSTVDIFLMNGNCHEHVFTHNGHSPSNSPLSIVTDHIWLDTGNKEFVVSICSNKTLNCWDYNPNYNVEKKI